MEQKIAIEEQPSLQEPIEEFKVGDWFEPEGELAVDVYQTEKEVVIQSAIAGVRPDELDIAVENDVVTIRGVRKNPNSSEEKQYLHEECFWGTFSRQIFLPEEVDMKNVEALMRDGVLTLRLPKLNREKTKKVKITRQ
ncbi:MAG: Hsp20/alpha crystallin family protein [Patescibacteria group bacterium]